MALPGRHERPCQQQPPFYPRNTGGALRLAVLRAVPLFRWLRTACWDPSTPQSASLTAPPPLPVPAQYPVSAALQLGVGPGLQLCRRLGLCVDIAVWRCALVRSLISHRSCKGYGDWRSHKCQEDVTCVYSAQPALHPPAPAADHEAAAIPEGVIKGARLAGGTTNECGRLEVLVNNTCGWLGWCLMPLHVCYRFLTAWASACKAYAARPAWHDAGQSLPLCMARMHTAVCVLPLPATLTAAGQGAGCVPRDSIPGRWQSPAVGWASTQMWLRAPGGEVSITTIRVLAKPPGRCGLTRSVGQNLAWLVQSQLAENR